MVHIVIARAGKPEATSGSGAWDHAQGACKIPMIYKRSSCVFFRKTHNELC